MENPTNEVKILENKPLTLDDTAETGKFVHISPQKIQMKLRIGEIEKIKFNVAQAKQYPVDIYYLMDLSNSMSDDRDTIVSRIGWYVTDSYDLHLVNKKYIKNA